ncbi:efflux RND transporter periplasmic adaptor subunit [Miniimonas sp. S16]|uniref:efflux RND transporter periplasmic adaptor subunit n=1 Tax=Miniimonas sp. S16 TaxID=2171623 RepID=UPI00131EE286|nr:biotin/lipoyl-binding protein [Miniimonas sp. S16]
MRLHLPRPRVLVAAGAVLVLAVAAVLWFAVMRPAQAATTSATSQTLTAQATLTTFEQSVTTSGTLTPAVNETVSFAATGTVQTVDVAEGDTVTAGQTLATIDTLQLDATRTEALYDLEVAKAALEEAQDADDDSDGANALVESRTAALAVAQSAYDDAEAAMADATLVAPVAGLVTSVGVAVGDAVSGSSSASAGGGTTGATGAGGSTGSSTTTTASGAFTVVGTDAWTVSVSVGESDVADLAVGNQVEMTSDDVSGTIFGVVTEIGKLPSSSSGSVTYPVTIEVTGDGEGLYDGVAVDVSIIYSRRTDVLAIPSAAVTQNADGTATVELVTSSGTSDGAASDGATPGGDSTAGSADADSANAVETMTTTVELGETSGSTVEITSGLSEGDTVQYTVAIASQDTSGTGTQDQQGQLPGGGELPGGDGQMPDFSGGFPGGQG